MGKRWSLMGGAGQTNHPASAGSSTGSCCHVHVESSSASATLLSTETYSHAIKIPLLRCTTQWSPVCSELYNRHCCFQNVSIVPKETCTPVPASPPVPGSRRSTICLWICLSWPLHISGTVQYVEYVVLHFWLLRSVQCCQRSPLLSSVSELPSFYG